MESKIAVIIPAGGAGSRIGSPRPKQFLKLAGVPMLVHTVRAFTQCSAISQIIVAAPKKYINETREMFNTYQLPVDVIVAGGKTRQHSVAAALAVVGQEVQAVLVHDGARPLVTQKIIKACLAALAEYGAAVAAIPVADTLKAVDKNNTVRHTVDRAGLWQAQTPQGARLDLLLKAFETADRDDFIGTDEAALLEHCNIPVAISRGSSQNLKVTRQQDLEVAEAILMSRSPHEGKQELFKIGHGYDAHQLVPDRPLVLGGVTVPHHAGLAGHSDADVLTHALCDAILGALGEGDIGRHFPDTDPQYRGINSLLLLEKVAALALEKNFIPTNADLTIIAQQPKLVSFVKDMQMNLSRACHVGPEAINIKATTTENLGFTGREEGMAAHAVVLLVKR